MPNRTKTYTAPGIDHAENPTRNYARRIANEPGRRWYNTSDWRDARNTYLAANPLCRECLKQGYLTEATHVDHRLKHAGNYWLFWDAENFQSLCARCHTHKTRRESRMNPHTKCVLVYGPPGAGKSTYVHKNKQPGDIVLDVDAVWRTLTAGERFYRPDALWPFVADAFRSLVVAAMLANVPRWIVIGGATQRERLIGGLNATHLPINPGRDVCERQIRNDPSRTNGVAECLRWLSVWFDKYEKPIQS